MQPKHYKTRNNLITVRSNKIFFKLFHLDSLTAATIVVNLAWHKMESRGWGKESRKWKEDFSFLLRFSSACFSLFSYCVESNWRLGEDSKIFFQILKDYLSSIMMLLRHIRSLAMFLLHNIEICNWERKAEKKLIFAAWN